MWPRHLFRSRHLAPSPRRRIFHTAGYLSSPSNSNPASRKWSSNAKALVRPSSHITWKLSVSSSDQGVYLPAYASLARRVPYERGGTPLALQRGKHVCRREYVTHPRKTRRMKYSRCSSKPVHASDTITM